MDIDDKSTPSGAVTRADPTMRYPATCDTWTTKIHRRSTGKRSPQAEVYSLENISREDAGILLQLPLMQSVDDADSRLGQLKFALDKVWHDAKLLH